MADTIGIACPECGKEFQVPATAVGKKVRCKVCGEVIPVTGQPSPARAATPGKPPAPGKAAKPAAAAPRHAGDPDDDGKPYGLGNQDLGARCPECAEAMGENDLICLKCGYNIRTRSRAGTKKVLDQTGTDVFSWLLPGILCVALILILIVFNILYLVKVGDWFPKDHSMSFLAWGVCKTYLVICSLGVSFFAGRFAIRRLILHPTPPEVELR